MASKKEIIERWKSLGINECRFNFNCGGDSMGDTDIEFETLSGEIIKDEILFDYFDRQVYNEVDFYVNSDGHYMGENGTVSITLYDEGGEDFNYNKTATSEWESIITQGFYVPITDEEHRILEEYILNIGHNDWGGDFILYKKDFILTDEINEVLVGLRDKLNDYTEGFSPDTPLEVSDRDIDFALRETNDDSTPIEYSEVDGQKSVKVICEFIVFEYRDDVD